MYNLHYVYSQDLFLNTCKNFKNAKIGEKWRMEPSLLSPKMCFHIKSSKIYSCLFVSSTNLFHQQNLQLFLSLFINSPFISICAIVSWFSQSEVLSDLPSVGCCVSLLLTQHCCRWCGTLESRHKRKGSENPFQEKSCYFSGYISSRIYICYIFQSHACVAYKFLVSE